VSDASIHATAILAEDVAVGSGTVVGPYAVIESDVQIGSDCQIGPHTVIGSGTRLGSRCRVFAGASLGLIPQDLKFAGEKTYLYVGDDTTVRECATLNRGTKARGETRVGSHCLVMAYCHIGHDCVIGDHVVLANNLAMAGHVEVGNYATIGGIVPVHQFTRIGDYAFIAAAARPFQDVPPFALVGAEPTRIVGINKVGLERRGFTPQRRSDISRAFRVLFRKHKRFADGVAELCKSHPDNADVDMIVKFCEASTRGIMRMGRGKADL
jgi:UDP-N-acetylglucosamine acyltransferase